MKRISSLILAAALAACALSSCRKDEVTADPALAVTYANLHGTWKLDSWKGAPLADGLYCYVTFNRKDRSFELSENLSSMYMNTLTGKFSIEKDDYGRYILSGEYDYGRGPWSSGYEVTDLLPSGIMTWTSLNSPEDVCIYVRADINEIPYSINHL